jgi:hypothetical protein
MSHGFFLFPLAALCLALSAAMPARAQINLNAAAAPIPLPPLPSAVAPDPTGAGKAIPPVIAYPGPAGLDPRRRSRRETFQDRAIRCQHEGRAAGVSARNLGRYTALCAN